MSKPEQPLDKSLRENILNILRGFGISGGRFNERTDEIMELVTQSQNALLTRIEDEVIDKDEIGYWSDVRDAITDRGLSWFCEWAEVVAQNKLRATQRQALQKIKEEI